MSASGSSIVERMRNHLERHIAWLEDSIERMEKIHTRMTEEEISELLNEERVRTGNAATLEREFHLLKREWDAAEDISETARAAVVQMAGRAQALSEQVVAAQDQAMETVAEHLDSIQDSILELRKGRNVLKKYGGGDDESGAHVDKGM